MEKKELIENFSHPDERWIIIFGKIKEYFIEQSSHKQYYQINIKRHNRIVALTFTDLFLPFGKEEEILNLITQYISDSEIKNSIDKFDEILSCKNKEHLELFMKQWLNIYNNFTDKEKLVHKIEFKLDVKTKTIYFNAIKVRFFQKDTSELGINEFTKLFVDNDPTNMPFSPRIISHIIDQDTALNILKKKYLIVTPQSVNEPYKFENVFEAKKFINEINQLYGEKNMLTKHKNMI